MAKTCLLILLSVLTQISFGQKAKDVDSLEHALQQSIRDSNQVKILLNLANALIYTDPDSAMKYADDAMEMSNAINWQSGVALSLRQQGYVYYVRSDYTKSIDKYFNALRAGKSINSGYFEATLYNNIANIYADLKNYDKALSYYYKYIAVAKSVKSRKDEMYGYSNIGTVYMEIDSMAASLACFKTALQISNETHNKRISATILNNLGEIFMKQKEYETAASYFTTSIALADSTGNINVKSTALNGLAIIFFHHKKYIQAEAYSKRALKFATEVGEISWQANALENLSNVYEKTNQPARALAMYKQSVVLKDSVENAAKKEDVTRISMQYAFDKKEAEAKAENRKRQAVADATINREKTIKKFILAGACLVIISSIIIFILYKHRRDAEEKKHEAEFKVQALDTELKALRAQMNPHFIFNSLNSITDYIEKHDIKNATLYTTKFAKLMRQILENSDRKEVPIAEDLKALELYMQLESLRLNNKFSYEIRVDDDIDQQNTLIPPLILQPFVENSIWHGISKKEGEGKIWIHIQKKGDMINCIVRDNGVGIHENADRALSANEKKSLGMKITRSRIDVLNRLKKSNAAVTMVSLEEGTKVEVTFPEALTF
jgi:tetratricopeptide (TPR) repeat protein